VLVICNICGDISMSHFKQFSVAHLSSLVIINLITMKV
jgi:hypothetical protein